MNRLEGFSSRVVEQNAARPGILFDRPHVVRDAPALLRAGGIEARVTIEAGDFFETVPAGGDIYLLSHIIHDWNEDQCLAILGHCCKVINCTLAKTGVLISKRPLRAHL